MKNHSLFLFSIGLVFLGILSLNYEVFADHDRPYYIYLVDELNFEEKYGEFYDEFGRYDFGFIDLANYEHVQIIDDNFYDTKQFEQENILSKQQVNKLEQLNDSLNVTDDVQVIHLSIHDSLNISDDILVHKLTFE